MAVTNYHSARGRIEGQHDPTNGFLAYATDALGSVCKTVDSTGTTRRSVQYKPWGEMWKASGSGVTPKFNWVGAYGYYYTGLQYEMVSRYVRARHYSGPMASWTTVDPLWPGERAYMYVRNRTTSKFDKSGRKTSTNIVDLNCGTSFNDVCKKVRTCLANDRCVEDLFECVGGVDLIFFNRVLDQLSQACGEYDDEFIGPLLNPRKRICVACQQNLGRVKDYGKFLKDNCSCSGRKGVTLFPFKTTPIFGDPAVDVNDMKTGEVLPNCAGNGPHESDKICGALLQSTVGKDKQCDSYVMLCPSATNATLLHEMIHVFGVGKGKYHGDQSVFNTNPKDFVDRLEGCMDNHILGNGKNNDGL